MTEEEIINAGIDYAISNHPVMMGGGNFADAMRTLNRNVDFEAGAKWAIEQMKKGDKK